jgi:hypothetical protein
MPSSTRATGKRTSFIDWKTASSSESRLTVTRSRPARASARALRGSSEPLVVRVRSARPSPRGGSIADQPLDVAAHERLAAGERILSTPAPTNSRASALDLLEGQQLERRRNAKSCRTPPSACSRCSGSCSGR